jgi:hypothetical protein
MVLAAKHAHYLCSIMKELGFEQQAPTPLWMDNQSVINMINTCVPTEHSRHIDIQHFAIQDWKDASNIIIAFIPGILNPLDDLTKPLSWVLNERHAFASLWGITNLFVFFSYYIFYIISTGVVEIILYVSVWSTVLHPPSPSYNQWFD